MTAEAHGEREERLRRARRGLWRTVLFWGPIFLLAAFGFLWFFIRQLAGEGDGWVLPIVLLVFGSLFGFQAIQALRDLQGETTTIEGRITRRWRRFDLLSRSHYLRIENGAIIRLDRVQYLLVEQGDYVAIEYYPASMLAVTVEKREPPEGAEPPDEPDDASKAPAPDPLLIERE